MHLIKTEDLLPRRERALDYKPVAKWLRGKHVAVTGAGGFIGGELSRQLANAEVASLLLVDNCEHGLYQIGRQVPTARIAMGDVRDHDRMKQVLGPADIVFHAAAMKHVPMCEDNRSEAFETNVIGTRNVIFGARNAQLVMVSTDKACRPTSFMGKTKATAERHMTASGRAAVVRFGNVIGSSGSVVPLFKEQIAAGGPVTVTHKDMTRYFMTVGEATELILQAGARGVGTYVLDMGTPVSIWTLAEEMVRLSGRRDVSIVETGIRPGEKMHEELSSEPLVETGIDGLRRVME